MMHLHQIDIWRIGVSSFVSNNFLLFLQKRWSPSVRLLLRSNSPKRMTTYLVLHSHDFLFFFLSHFFFSFSIFLYFLCILPIVFSCSSPIRLASFVILIINLLRGIYLILYLVLVRLFTQRTNPEPTSLRQSNIHFRSGNSRDFASAKLYWTLPFPWTTWMAKRGDTFCRGSRRSFKKKIRLRPAPWRWYCSVVSPRQQNMGSNISSDEKSICMGNWSPARKHEDGICFTPSTLSKSEIWRGVSRGVKSPEMRVSSREEETWREGMWEEKKWRLASLVKHTQRKGPHMTTSG